MQVPRGTGTPRRQGEAGEARQQPGQPVCPGAIAELQAPVPALDTMKISPS